MFCIGAIFKNEGPYILEWIAYHQTIGVNKFYIVDNVSNDSSSQMLCDLHTLGIINRIEYKNENGVKPQLPAYKKIIENLTDDDEFIAFIDADEFVHLNDPNGTVDSIINIFNDNDIGAVALNWAVYGSSSCIIPRNDSLVIERFDHRAPQDYPTNNHYKSVIRRSKLIDIGENAHFFKVEGKYVLSDLTEINKLTGLSNTISWETCRINHYVVKSKSEFFSKKAARGRPSGKDSDLNDKFFNYHDMNTVREQYPYSFISKVKNQIDYLELKISNRLTPYKVKSLYKSEYNSGTAFIDKVTYTNELITIIGWAVAKDKKSYHDIAIIINNEKYMNNYSFAKVERHDVCAHAISDEILCGFTIIIDPKNIVVNEINSVSIYALDKNKDCICELNLVKHKNILLTALPNLL